MRDAKCAENSELTAYEVYLVGSVSGEGETLERAPYRWEGFNS